MGAGNGKARREALKNETKESKRCYVVLNSNQHQVGVEDDSGHVVAGIGSGKNWQGDFYRSAEIQPCMTCGGWKLECNGTCKC